MKANRAIHAFAGILGGLAVGVLVIVAATAASIFSALQSERDRGFFDIAQARYTVGANGGFDLGVSGGGGIAVVLLAGAVLGVLVPPVLRRLRHGTGGRSGGGHGLRSGPI